MLAHIPYLQNHVFVCLHCSHLGTVLLVASHFIVIEDFMVTFRKFVLHLNRICT